MKHPRHDLAIPCLLAAAIHACSLSVVTADAAASAAWTGLRGAAAMPMAPKLQNAPLGAAVGQQPSWQSTGDSVAPWQMWPNGATQPRSSSLQEEAFAQDPTAAQQLVSSNLQAWQKATGLLQEVDQLTSELNVARAGLPGEDRISSEMNTDLRRAVDSAHAQGVPQQEGFMQGSSQAWQQVHQLLQEASQPTVAPAPSTPSGVIPVDPVQGDPLRISVPEPKAVAVSVPADPVSDSAHALPCAGGPDPLVIPKAFAKAAAPVQAANAPAAQIPEAPHASPSPRQVSVAPVTEVIPEPQHAASGPEIPVESRVPSQAVASPCPPWVVEIPELPFQPAEVPELPLGPPPPSQASTDSHPQMPEPTPGQANPGPPLDTIDTIDPIEVAASSQAMPDPKPLMPDPVAAAVPRQGLSPSPALPGATVQSDPIVQPSQSQARPLSQIPDRVYGSPPGQAQSPPAENEQPVALPPEMPTEQELEEEAAANAATSTTTPPWLNASQVVEDVISEGGDSPCDKIAEVIGESPEDLAKAAEKIERLAEATEVLGQAEEMKDRALANEVAKSHARSAKEAQELQSERENVTDREHVLSEEETEEQTWQRSLEEQHAFAETCHNQVEQLLEHLQNQRTHTANLNASRDEEATAQASKLERLKAEQELLYEEIARAEQGATIALKSLTQVLRSEEELKNNTAANLNQMEVRLDAVIKETQDEHQESLRQVRNKADQEHLLRELQRELPQLHDRLAPVEHLGLVTTNKELLQEYMEVQKELVRIVAAQAQADAQEKAEKERLSELHAAVDKAHADLLEAKAEGNRTLMETIREVAEHEKSARAELHKAEGELQGVCQERWQAHEKQLNETLRSCQIIQQELRVAQAQQKTLTQILIAEHPPRRNP